MNQALHDVADWPLTGDDDAGMVAALPQPVRMEFGEVGNVEREELRTAEALDTRVRAAVHDSEPRLHALVLDLEGVDFVDSQGAAKLAELHEVTAADGVSLRLARLKPQVATVLDADGTIEVLGGDHVHGNVYEAVEAQLAEDGGHAVSTVAD